VELTQCPDCGDSLVDKHSALLFGGVTLIHYPTAGVHLSDNGGGFAHIDTVDMRDIGPAPTPYRIALPREFSAAVDAWMARRLKPLRGKTA
jgi:hypothetical protein